MGKTEQNVSGWESAARAALRELSTKDMPAKAPAESEAIAATRKKVVAGAHEFAGPPKGMAHLVGLLASGKAGDVSEDTLRGITAIFQAWDDLAGAGFVLPWRTREGMESWASADMVTSHVETLIERMTGADKAKVDPDGDYPIRHRSALYYVRVVPAWNPVVQIFSVAVDGIPFTDALACDLNELNARLHFCRTFWVRGQVLIEAEHLGASLTEADFHECALHVTEATDA